MYIVGGIVDKQVSASLTLDAAMAHGVSAYRLPVEEHLGKLGKRRSNVLNVDTVVMIITLYAAHRDWLTALREAIPQRK